jgi:hypothetical protein
MRAKSKDRSHERETSDKQRQEVVEELLHRRSIGVEMAQNGNTYGLSIKKATTKQILFLKCQNTVWFKFFHLTGLQGRGILNDLGDVIDCTNYNDQANKLFLYRYSLLLLLFIWGSYNRVEPNYKALSA